MAAYGALVSVMQIIDQLHRHPHPPISLHKEHVESLTANLTFLQKFLEGYNPHRIYTSEADPLESRIAEAAYAAEDVIENYIVDQIQARSIDHDGGKISSTQFYHGLEKVIQEMDLIKMEIVEKKMEGVQIIKKQSTTDDSADSSRSSSIPHKVTTTVGLDEVLNEMLEKIATGSPRVRQIIPIIGMGGLGKTTLARNIYENQLVKEHFDICAWSTISQVHNARKILTEILGQVGLDTEGDLSDAELGVKLYQHLIGKRYLIVMDDMWSIEAWDKVKSSFPDNNKGSRVVVTTRLSNLASMFNYSDGLDMEFMDEATSWELFSKTVFGDKSCPLELEDVGKKIVEGCRGLPLSIVVVGGLLSKSEATRENWQVIEERLSWVVNSEGDGNCLQTLYVSYNNLPVHLKPCFLYLGLYPEDEVIEVILLIAQWVAEGFVKPVDGKSLEEAAQEYLEELVDRNLVLVESRDHFGDVAFIKIHDLLRDLALREGEKDKFVWSREISQGMTSGQRRITNSPKDESLVEAAATVRTLIGNFDVQILPISRFRLLRVCFFEYEDSIFDEYYEDSIFDEYYEDSIFDEYYEDILIRLLNLRLLYVPDDHPLPRIPCYIWNLQTLILVSVDEEYVLEIWKMPLLRHVITDRPLLLSNPPLDDEVIVLENLHTLFSEMRNLKLSEDVLQRIPNVRMLRLYYQEEEEEEEEEKKGNYYCLNNLHCLNKLRNLYLKIRYGSYTAPVQELSLPHSLVQLTLKGAKLPWEEMASKIGCLPLLQVLRLKKDAFVGSEWVTVEGQFSSLKFLEINECGDLEQWITDDYTHFPRLEQLVLRNLHWLREIPSCIGDIPTLESIDVISCSDSLVESARRIQEEQEEYGNELLQIQITSLTYSSSLSSSEETFL